MKKIFFIVLLLAIGYFAYKSFYKDKPFKIQDILIVNQSSSLDINSASPTPPLRYAYIQGTIESKSKVVLSNISVIYTIGYDTIYAGINSIMPGESAQFKTNRCRVRSANSNYELINIKFEEAGD